MNSHKNNCARFLLSCTAVALLPALAFSTALAQTPTPEAPPELTVDYIMRDLKWLGSRARQVEWSPDSRRVYFQWNPDGTDGDSLYVVPAAGGPPRQVTFEERRTRPTDGGAWNRDFSRYLYSKDGDLFLLDVNNGRVRPLTSTVDHEGSPAFTRDGRAVLFERDENVYKLDLATGFLAQLTDFREGSKRDAKADEPSWLAKQQLALIQTLRERKERRDRAREQRDSLEPNRPPAVYLKNRKLEWSAPSPDGRFVCFVLADEPKDESLTEVPNYVTESGYTKSDKAREKVGAPQATYELGVINLEHDSVYYVAIDSLPGIYTPPAYRAEYEQADTGRDSGSASLPPARTVYYSGLEWSDDGSRCALDVRSQDFKDRWLVSLHLETGRLATVDHQHDEAWIGGPGVGWRAPMGWLSDHKTLWFQSEASGYSHIHTVDVESGERSQQTSGNWEVEHLSISRDRKHWYFHANPDHAGDWQYYKLSTSGGIPVRLTSGRGEHRAYLSPDESQLAILYSTSTRPTQLYLQENKPGARMRPVTQSFSQEFLSYPWREAEIVHFPASDGARVPARIYRPAKPSPGGPGVIFVHGAGYLQNVTYGWSGYEREYMFHNLLADRGYTVLDIDYRASSGYGRDWRTAIYRHMGGRDLADHLDGARYLVAACGVDSARIGIYGGSYGGFITLMALFQHPGVFACGAALRSVTDWAHYNHWYTARILNTPETDSLAYLRSSPIYFADGLKDPLLMCHSILDENVQYQDIVRLTQRLIELGKKDWELAVYPIEDHSIIESEAWTDEYTRIFNLFEEHLRK